MTYEEKETSNARINVGEGTVLDEKTNNKKNMLKLF